MISFDQLRQHFDVVPDRYAKNTFILRFYFDRAVTSTIRIEFKEVETGIAKEITNMTTLPDTEVRKGHGTKALTLLLGWASIYNIKTIHAVQVQKQSEGFWEKRGFVRTGNRFNDFLYTG